MKSFLSRIFGGSSQEPLGEERGPERGEPVIYEGLVIHGVPEKDGGRWRLAGVIIKESAEGDLERHFLRADTFTSREEAESFAIRKGQQIIDERGMRLFADGEKTGRA